MSAFEELSLDEPLPLIILVKGDSTYQWEALAQAAIPVLLRPHDFPSAQRKQIAQSLRQLLEGDFSEAESFAEENAATNPANASTGQNGRRSDDVLCPLQEEPVLGRL